MLKKAYIFFIIFTITFINKVWAGDTVLQLDDIEIERRSFHRVLDNLEDFYQVNAAQVTTLNTQKFFEDPENPSALAKQALIEITKNRKASIMRDYLKKRQLLKKHLLRIRGCFKENQTAEDLEASQTSNLLSYTNGLLCILYGLGVR